MAVVLGGRHLRGRLVLVIELRKLEFIWVGMVSCRKAEHAAKYRAGSIDGNGGQADMSQSFIFIKPKEELNKSRVGVGLACLQITLSAL